MVGAALVHSPSRKAKGAALPAIGAADKLDAAATRQLVSRLQQQTMQQLRNKQKVLRRYTPKPAKTQRTFVIARSPSPEKPARGGADGGDDQDARLGVTLKTRPGLLPVITKVVQGSPAARAGVSAGNVLLSLNGRKVPHKDMWNGTLPATFNNSLRHQGAVAIALQLQVPREPEQRPAPLEEAGRPRSRGAPCSECGVCFSHTHSCPVPGAQRASPRGRKVTCRQMWHGANADAPAPSSRPQPKGPGRRERGKGAGRRRHGGGKRGQARRAPSPTAAAPDTGVSTAGGPAVPTTAKLHEAALTNDVATLAGLLASPGADIDAVDATHCTALHLAASAGHARSVKLLLGLGADASKRCDLDGMTALHYATEAGDPATLAHLIKHVTAAFTSGGGAPAAGAAGTAGTAGTATGSVVGTGPRSATPAAAAAATAKAGGPSARPVRTTQAATPPRGATRSRGSAGPRGPEVESGGEAGPDAPRMPGHARRTGTGTSTVAGALGDDDADEGGEALADHGSPPLQINVCGINVQRTCNGVYTHLAPGDEFKGASLVPHAADGRAIYKHSTEDLFMRYISDRKCWMISALKHVNSSDSEQRARGYVYSRDDAVHPTEVLDWEVHGFDGWALSSLVTVTDVEQPPPTFMEINGLRDRVARFNGYRPTYYLIRGAVQSPMGGGKFDFVWRPGAARAMHTPRGPSSRVVPDCLTKSRQPPTLTRV